MAKTNRPHLVGLGAGALLVAAVMPLLPSSTRVALGSVYFVLAAASVFFLEQGPTLSLLLGLIAASAAAQVVVAAAQQDPSVFALGVQGLILGSGIVVITALRPRLVDRDQVVEDKDQLLSIISHQLRTPLTAVVGFAELLRSEPERTSPEERRAMLADLTSHAFELSAMFDDLLVASRAELNDLEVVSVPVSLRSQLNQELETWIPDDKLQERVDVVGEVPPVRGDPGRIRHVLHNLIANALRHGGEQIRIILDTEDEYGRVTVADNGSGIAPEVAESLFEPYHRAVPTLLPGPLGLGLSVARHLSHLMGGDISYRRRGDWTEFRLVLPLVDATPRFSPLPPGGEMRHPERN